MIDCLFHRQGTEGEWSIFTSTDGTRSNWDPQIHTVPRRWRC